MTKPLVSVHCVTYNHEKYIRECLDGFVIQKTEFIFEVLIHDDASTDGTADIIRAYQKKYPDLIKPIFQTENQYQNGVNIIAAFNVPRAQGTYIAMCEGDDYWIDPLKLQKQVDFMKHNPSFAGCFHPTYRLCDQTGKKTIFSYQKDVITTRELIKFGGGGMIDTCAIFYKKEVLKRASPWYDIMPLDQTSNLRISLNGPIGKVDAVMSVYRINQAQSWIGVQGKDLKKRIKFCLREIKMWRLFYKTESSKYRGTVALAIFKIGMLYVYNIMLFILKKSIGSKRFYKFKESIRR
jgi:glycosyltransferase involved in cell wall biosynthesis